MTTRPTTGSERVLVVDDNAIARTVNSRLLEKLGYRVDLADSGAAALAPRMERVELLSMPDVATQVSALTTGEVDYLERLPADVLPVLERNRAVRVQVVSPYGYQGILRFNHLHPPFNDVRVRRAVMMAVDQNEYLPGVAGRADYGRECRSMYGCGTPLETTAGMPERADLAGARRLLAESGALPVGAVEAWQPPVDAGVERAQDLQDYTRRVFGAISRD